MKTTLFVAFLLSAVLLLTSCGGEDVALIYEAYDAHDGVTFFERFIDTHATEYGIEFDDFMRQWDIGTFFQEGRFWGGYNFTSLEHLEHLLGHEQRYSHAITIAEMMSEYLSIVILPEEMAEHLITFSWRDRVTDEQFEIALTHLGVPPGMFNDNIVHAYMWSAQPPGILSEIDASLAREEQLGTPSEFAPNHPQRIIVEMYQGLTDFANSYQEESGTN